MGGGAEEVQAPSIQVGGIWGGWDIDQWSDPADGNFLLSRKGNYGGILKVLVPLQKTKPGNSKLYILGCNLNKGNLGSISLKHKPESRPLD